MYDMDQFFNIFKIKSTDSTADHWSSVSETFKFRIMIKNNLLSNTISKQFGEHATREINIRIMNQTQAFCEDKTL